MIDLTLHPFRDHSAKLAITFAFGDMIIRNLAPPLIFTSTLLVSRHQTLTKIILRNSLYSLANPPKITFLHLSQKQPLFYFEAFVLSLGTHISVPGKNTRSIKFQLPETKNKPQTGTLNTGIPFIQLPQKHCPQLSFTENYDSNVQA